VWGPPVTHRSRSSGVLAQSLLAVALCLAAPATAQPAEPPAPTPESTPPPEKGAEVITITGSRIGRSNLTELGPVTILDAEDIAFSGATTIDELLRDLPAVTLQGINKNNNNGGEGLAQIDLRNLGIQRTLVLINGRRVVVNGTGVSEAVDLNNIPVAMIERVEVLLEGASAVYGSDAVGGVVNFILKDDFEGFRIDGFAGSASRWDTQEGTLSATLGNNFDEDRGNVTFNFSFLDRSELPQDQRHWAKDPIVAEIPLSPGVLRIYGSGAVPEGRVFTPIADPDEGDDLHFDPQNGKSYSGTHPFEIDATDKNKFGDRYNYGEEQWLTGAQQRLSFAMNGHYTMLEDRSDAFVDDIDLFLEGMYAHRKSDLQLAPQPLGLEGEFIVSSANPFLPADFAPLLGADPSFGMLRRMDEIGNRKFEVTSDFYRVVGGVRGEILDRFDWEAFVNWGRTEADEVIRNSINIRRANESADPTLCAAAAAYGCVVGDFFGAGALFNTPGAIDYMRYTDTEVTIFEELQTGLNLNGDLFDPWGEGPIGFAIGAEYRNEEGENRPSPTTVGGESAGNALQATEGGYDVREGFIEFRVPLLNEEFLVHDLRTDLAGRWTHYDTFGGDTTYRLGLQYAPTVDVRFRGSYSTAFRAPGIADLFGGGAESFELLNDPCNDWDTDPNLDPTVAANCGAGGGPFGLNPVQPGFNQTVIGNNQISTDIGGNPNLEAETADLWNLGVILTPRFVPEFLDFSLTLDWYDITVDNAIDALDPAFILTSCYESMGLTGSTCSLFTRNASNQNLIQQINATEQNLNQLKVRGFDLTTNFGFELEEVGFVPGLGRLDFMFAGNHLDTHEVDSPAGSSNLVRQIGLAGGIFPEWQLNSLVRYSVDDWAFQSLVRWIDGANISDAVPGDVTTDVEPVAYWDLAAQRNFQNWSLIVGVNNVTDVEPPRVIEGGQNANAESYDFIGRFLFTQVTYRF